MADMIVETRYRVDGMDCGGCARKIDTAMRRIDGVEDVTVSVTTGTMIVHHIEDAALGPVIEKQVTRLGFGVAVIEDPARPKLAVADDCACCPDQQDDALDSETGAVPVGQAHGQTGSRWWQSRKGRLTIASGAALIVAYGVGLAVPGIRDWVFIAAILVGLVPVAQRAAMAAVSGSPFTIEMLMSLATIGAIALGDSEEAAAVVFLFLIGELLEGVAAGKARASIQSLTALVPKTALLERNGRTQEVAADRLAVGATIVVRPGDRIPADGVIVSGDSAIDEASMTGESMPVQKGADAPVFAGTINGDGVLRVRVTAAAADNTIARIVRLVEEAQESKAPIERFIDRFSRYYTPAVVGIAVFIAVFPPLVLGAPWHEWIYKSLAILLIGCPCALVISTPAAIAAGLSWGARRGLLIKGGAALETLAKVSAVAFDKTGTLTDGVPEVTDVIGVGRTGAEVLRLAAALEAGSNHPLAKAILAQIGQDDTKLPQAVNAKALAGKGITGIVEGINVFFGSPVAAAERVPYDAALAGRIATLNGEGKTVSVLLVDGAVAGLVAMRDEPRADAMAGLKALTEAGISTIMLTGDNRATATAIGARLGIAVRAELLPEDKRDIVTAMKKDGRVVAKVGDGINDAPALAAADVGIAMGGGTDVALETADAAVLHARVGDVAAMLRLAKRTMGNIHQNIVIAIGFKVVFLATTIAGLTGLWPAIMADTGATVVVTMNALRLL